MAGAGATAGMAAPDDGLPAEVLDVPAVGRFADVGGTARDMALAAHARWGCAIDLIDIDSAGRLRAEASDWVAPYVAALVAGGVPPDAIRRVGRAEDLAPAHLVTMLRGFGDTLRVRRAEPVLARGLAPGGRVLLDIRKGSGAFPFLRSWGRVVALETRGAERGTSLRAMLYRTEPSVPEGAPRPEAAPEPWPVTARRLAGPAGFYRESRDHAFLFVPRGRTLVVAFDNLDIAMGKRADRRPWGFAFIERQGWSMLGVTAAGWTWFRDPWVLDQFATLRDTGFFAGFDRVVFYGASMGGYAAAAFAGFCPGADAVAIAPQSTLDRATVPWETRYRTAWGRDFGAPFGDAAEASRAAGRVFLFYDPHERLDAAHAARFTGGNVIRLRAPLLGHRLGSSLQQMGILSPVILAALDGSLTEAEFYRALRARRTFPRYQKELFRRAVARGRPGLARKVARWVLTRGDNRFIRKALAAL